jgi:tRNA pseudouridine55 synthase
MTGLAQSCAIADGVLIVRKEAGWTSHDVVAKIRQLLGGVKVGHAGTLDPAATGVLPVLIGKGTRIAEYLVEWDKEYRAVLRLGETTDTQDATGTILARQATDGVTAAAIHEAAGRFRGAIEQVPPMYSAVKVAGVPLYKSARAGKTVVREARTIVIHKLDILAIDGRDVTLHVVCSKGTYVRRHRRGVRSWWTHVGVGTMPGRSADDRPSPDRR